MPKFKSMRFNPKSEEEFNTVINIWRELWYKDYHHKRSYSDMIKDRKSYIQTDITWDIFYRDDSDHLWEEYILHSVSNFKYQIEDVITPTLVRKHMFEEQVQKAYNSTIVSTPIVHNTFYNLNEKIMTLADKIFERFLKSNEKKVIEATERAEAIQEEISPLLKPFNELSLELAAVKNTLEKAFNSQDKENIKFYLKELQKINAIFDDKLFDQLKTVLKAINKSLSL